MIGNIYRISILFFMLTFCQISFAQAELVKVKVSNKLDLIGIKIDYGKISYDQKEILKDIGAYIEEAYTFDWKDKIIEQFEKKGWILYKETDEELDFQIDIGNPIDNSSANASLLYAEVDYAYQVYYVDVNYKKMNYDQQSKLSSRGLYIKRVNAGGPKDKIITQFEDKGWTLYSDVNKVLRFQIDIGNPVDNSSPDTPILYAKVKYHNISFADLTVDYGKISHDQMSKLNSIGAYIEEVKKSHWKDKIINQFEDKGWRLSRETDEILEFVIDITTPIDNSSPETPILYAKIKNNRYFIDLDVDYGKIDYNQISKLSHIGAYIKEVKQSHWKDKIINQFEDKGWKLSRETDEILEFVIDASNPIDNSLSDASILYAKIKNNRFFIDLPVDYGKIDYGQVSKLSRIGAYIEEVKQSHWKDKIIDQFEDKGWRLSRETDEMLEFEIDVAN